MSYELVFRSLINSSDQLSAINNQLYSEVSTFTPKMTIVGSFEAIRHTSSGSAQGWRIEQY
jgi:hypothetical protein